MSLAAGPRPRRPGPGSSRRSLDELSFPSSRYALLLPLGRQGFLTVTTEARYFLARYRRGLSALAVADGVR